MKVIYDNKSKMYGVIIEPGEAETIINTDDIVECRKEFVERMIWMFNNAVCDKLKYDTVKHNEATVIKECLDKEVGDGVRMKEVHAYINDDGTYRIDVIGEVCINGELIDACAEIPRAKLSIECLTNPPSN